MKSAWLSRPALSSCCYLPNLISYPSSLDLLFLVHTKLSSTEEPSQNFPGLLYNWLLLNIPDLFKYYFFGKSFLTMLIRLTQYGNQNSKMTHNYPYSCIIGWVWMGHVPILVFNCHNYAIYHLYMLLAQGSMQIEIRSLINWL